MRLLFCSEFYYPSVGGVQEVMRQLAERMVACGHVVVVATTRLADRQLKIHNGVQIVEFGVHGNNVLGIFGEADRYRKFVLEFAGDAMMIKAAQQWTFDALWPILDQISMRKVFIPCGFSGLYEPGFVDYFVKLPAVLRKFDHLIFYAERYRDVDFARAHGISNFTILPNGASEQEFDVVEDPEFRSRHGIGEDEFVFMTVGSLNGMKGHREIAEAFSLMNTSGRKATLILNGNAPPQPMVDLRAQPVVLEKTSDAVDFLRIRRRALAISSRLTGLFYRSFGVFRREGLLGVRQRIAGLVHAALPRLTRAMGFKKGVLPLEYWVKKANAQRLLKRVLVTDLGRADLVQAFITADLFVFASNIEYSPLVLFETVAAGTPFISVPVGNAEEIARWTGGGTIFPARKDERGYTWVDPSALALELEAALSRRPELQCVGAAAREVWKAHFTWGHIAQRYEDILASRSE